MQVDIDFEVFKALTALRREERDTLNDVLRRLTKLGSETPQGAISPAASSSAGCVYKGVLFPEGTRFRATYKGKTFYGNIKDGAWQDDVGNTYSSPSQAAFAIQKSGVNGWTFWECKRPEDSDWVRLCTLRSDYVPLSDLMAAASVTKQ